MVKIPDGRIAVVMTEGTVGGVITGVVGWTIGVLGWTMGVLVLVGQNVVVNVMTSVVEPTTIVDVPVDVVVVEPVSGGVADGLGIGVQFGRVNVPLKFPESPWTIQLL